MALVGNDKPSLFSESASSTLRLIGYLTFAVILMVADHHRDYLKRFRSTMSYIVEPVYRLAALPATLARNARLVVSERSELARENQQLRQELMLTQARLNRLANVQEQNQHLKELLDVQRTLGLGVQLAQLIDIDLDPFRHRIVINAGRSEGVKEKQAVLDAQGIMGQVLEVMEHTSVAILITDPAHALPVTIERTGLRTIAYGGGAIDQLVLPHIPVSADVKVGDKLVTSGMGGRFPAGFPVGEVGSVKNDETGMFAAALVKPSAALDRSAEVLLLQDLADPVGPPVPSEKLLNK